MEWRDDGGMNYEKHPLRRNTSPVFKCNEEATGVKERASE